MTDNLKFQELHEEPVKSSSNNDFQSELEQKHVVVAINENECSEESSYQNKLDLHNLIRLGFIRKVYGILLAQLSITILLCSLTFNENVKIFLFENQAIFWIISFLSIALAIPLLCFKSIARKVPINYIFLILWTLCESYLVACLCSIFTPKIVILAAVCTLGVTLGITIYAITTKNDFTFMGGLLFSGLSLIFMLTFLSFFFPFMNVLLCILGVFIYSLYLLYDTQLIFGKVGAEYNVDDYIIASLNIFLDIIQIFVYILQIIATITDN